MNGQARSFGLYNLLDVYDLSLETVGLGFLVPLFYPMLEGQRIYWLYLLVAFAMGSGVYLWMQRTGDKTAEGKSLLEYLFPKELYSHRSSMVDFQFFYANTVIQSLFLFPLFMMVSPVVMLLVAEAMLELGLPGEASLSVNLGSHLLFTACLALALDFGIFFAHYMQHKIPWLWEFHKVHHTAEVLTPITVYRMHPVDNLLNLACGTLMVGLVGGLMQFYYGGEAVLIQVLGVNLLFTLFYLFGYNLRHSHIWLDYGPFWSRVFISPAQHQIHHSSETRHFDKNQGFIFAFWDGLFGTLYVPDGHETFDLGIDDKDDQAHYGLSVWALYARPFVNMARKFRPQKLLSPVKIAYAAVFLVLVAGSLYFSVSYTKPLAAVDSKVYLENLTWQQVQAQLDGGTKTVIVPTGGTEQNGPHMVLGKHNFVVRHTAGLIATELGQTLVAPVMAYVPEGDITSREGHMGFAGTLSTPEPVFEALLEHAARSLKVHGFTVICFLGDSGGNQAAQQRVAEELTREWADEGVVVIHVSDYYDKNGQRAWLINQGKQKMMGSHAGIRDTSELMAVHPEGILDEELADNTLADRSQIGADGNAKQASPVLGKALINMKVRAAVRQIRRLSGLHQAN